MSQVIALVDDDRNILTSVSIALQQEGFVTRVYSDPVAALKALGDNPPDLGVFDIKMPNLDGMELLRRAARVQLDAGDLPDLQGRRARRGARPRNGRRRLYREALLPAPSDRPHPRDPAPPGARARRGGGQCGGARAGRRSSAAG